VAIPETVVLVTVPEDTVAIVASELLQVPPLVVVEIPTTFPIHTVVGPVMLVGNANTDKYLVLRQPLASV